MWQKIDDTGVGKRVGDISKQTTQPIPNFALGPQFPSQNPYSNVLAALFFLCVVPLASFVGLPHTKQIVNKVARHF